MLTGVLHGHEHAAAARGAERRRDRARAVDRLRARADLGLRALNYVIVPRQLPARGADRAAARPRALHDRSADGRRRRARRREALRVPLLVISEDVFPEIATQLGRLEQPRARRDAPAQLIGLYLKRADRVVAIGDTMRARLEAKGAPADRIRVIPNWVDTDAISPQPRDNAWARLNSGCSDKFVVMHSGQRRARPEPRDARARDDVPPRPRRPPDRDHRRRRAATRTRSPRRAAARPTSCVRCRTRRATCCRSRSPRADLHFVGLARGPRRASSCRAGSTGSWPPAARSIVAADAGERDGAGRRAGRLRHRRPARAAPSCSPR